MCNSSPSMDITDHCGMRSKQGRAICTLPSPDASQVALNAKHHEAFPDQRDAVSASRRGNDVLGNCTANGRTREAVLNDLVRGTPESGWCSETIDLRNLCK